ncbi:MAG: hypothetical protein WBB34_11800 [Xanthobacteraceae bacterium]
MKEVLEYLRETSCELAALADKDRFESLAYIFRMAALEADQRMAEPSEVDATTACELSRPMATILPFRLSDRGRKL